MRIAFIVVTLGESPLLVNDLKRQIKSLELRGSKFYEIKNKRGEEGYARGINKGIEKALKGKTDLFIILNSDLSLKKISGKKLLAAAEFFDVWGFAMKQRNTIYYGGEIDRWRMSGGLIIKKPKKRFVERDFVSGSMICIKKEVIDKIGPWDEKYFLYYEEVDYCFRARQAGFKVGIDSQNLYEHFELSENNNPLKDYYLKKNRIRFLHKYGTILQKLYELIRLPKTIFEDKEGFIFNFLSLNTSSLLNKISTFILFLFLIRFLSARDYGIYTLVWVQIGLLAPFADFGTTSYGILQSLFKKREVFSNLFSMRLSFSLLVFILTFLLAYILKFNTQALLFTLLASPVIFSNAFSGSLLILSSLKNKAYITSLISVGFNLCLTGLLIAILYFSRNLYLVFQIIFIAYILYALINLYILNKENKGISFLIRFPEWFKIVKKSSVFVLISFFAGLYFKIDVFLLNYLKGQQAIGVYSAGYKFLEALMFIPASYNIVSIPLLTKIFSNNKNFFLERVKRDFLYLGLFGVFFASALAFLAPRLFPLFLKGDFYGSIAVFQIVIFAFPLLFVTSIMLNGLYILKKSYVVVYLFLVQILFNAGLNWVFIPKYSYLASSYITVASEIINLLLSVILFKYFFRNYRASKS